MRAVRALRRASQARQPLREELASCSACAQQAFSSPVDRLSVPRARRVMPLNVRVHRAPERFASTTTLSPTVTMRSASEAEIRVRGR